MESALSIPDEALTANITIPGKKGRGKSYSAKGLVERLLDLGERVLILNPLGGWGAKGRRNKRVRKG